MDSQGTVIVVSVVVGSIVVILVIILFYLFMAIVVPRLVFRSIQGPLAQRIAAHYRPEDILLQDLRANCFGQASTGRFRLRGNGGLVLTHASLHFFLFMPRVDVAIPREAITGVTSTRSHLGKTIMYSLLKVSFSLNGKEDSLAWYVTDIEAWVSRIGTLTRDTSANENQLDTTT